MSAFIIPSKAIHNDTDFDSFKKSEALSMILDFVKKCAESAVGNTNNSIQKESTPVNEFCAFMERLYMLVDEIPPIKQPMRFGNKAFRDWHSQMLKESDAFLFCLLEPFGKTDASIELAPYIGDLFGNPTRIDYGTGHELNFAVFFLLLSKIGVLSDSKADLSALVTKGFVSYIRVMRKLQTVYMLEPAGSHGVWGLDDYHCLLFLWGSAQLSAQKEIKPSDINNAEVLKEESAEYLYLEGIQFIKKIKSSAPFAETSPMLNDISALHDWAKICSGLMRLFQAEVLGKFPVIQHLLFGSILHCSWTSEGAGPKTADGDKEHHFYAARPAHPDPTSGCLHSHSNHSGAPLAHTNSSHHIDLGATHQPSGYVARCVLEPAKIADVDQSVVPAEVVAAIPVVK